jgi:hypothetical protein
LVAEAVPVCKCGFKVSWEEGAPEEVIETAVAFRRLVQLVGSQVAVGIAGRLLRYTVLAGSATGQLISAYVVFIFVAVLSVAQLVTAYRLAKGIGENPAWATATIMCVPCLNVMMLLHLSSRATAWCRPYGIRVGLLGPSAATIEAAGR